MDGGDIEKGQYSSYDEAIGKAKEKIAESPLKVANICP